MRTPLQIADAAFPPDQCDYHPAHHFQPMFGERNYVPGHTRDATTSHVLPPGFPYLIG